MSCTNTMTPFDFPVIYISTSGANQRFVSSPLDSFRVSVYRSISWPGNDGETHACFLDIRRAIVMVRRVLL